MSEARKTILYKLLASTVDAYLNCKQEDANGQMRNVEWFHKHFEHIKALVRDHMPSGSGWDCGTKIDLDASNGEKLVFYGSFHHMNTNGCYDGYTEHKVIVTPSLAHSYRVKITGRDRNEIKDYLSDTFRWALDATLVWDETAQRWRNERYVGAPHAA